MKSDIDIYWEEFPVSEIPSKTDVSPLLHWCSSFSSPEKTRIIDVGCGCGTVSDIIAKSGFQVYGIDINENAIEYAKEHSNRCNFLKADITSLNRLPFGDHYFEGAVCQLLFSVVGDLRTRKRVLINLKRILTKEGRLFASFSGLSDDLNEEYRKIYSTDLSLTAEYGTYFSRDNNGTILYKTHHFTEEEINELLASSGFSIQDIYVKIETSSRRKDQKARFFYVDAIAENP
jgi:2-polyprenyl-3-methyl-5-hydroxy-6-metoxy-1,4-benzoquinol methylase